LAPSTGFRWLPSVVNRINIFSKAVFSMCIFNRGGHSRQLQRHFLLPNVYIGSCLEYALYILEYALYIHTICMCIFKSLAS
jgi:hypothetical protein